MTDENVKTPDKIINDENFYLAFQLIKRKEYDSAEAIIKQGIKDSRDKEDLNLEGLYYSAMGVLYKLKNDYKKAYKFYQQAEKILKDDASISIISATLLIEQFKQFDTASRKLKKVLENTTDPAIIHHALALQAIAFFCMGKKSQAKTNFENLLLQNFQELRFASNLDYKMVEFFVKKKFQIELCQNYLTKALELAKNKKEGAYQLIIKNLLGLI